MGKRPTSPSALLSPASTPTPTILSAPDRIDSKFGVALENGEALAIIKKALAMQHLHLKGVHCHIGSADF